jgi:PIN domain nuclease of toxin-antitoxin system
MNRVVLDASALLAILNQEPRAEKLTPELLSVAACSTVNLAEVHGKLVGKALALGTHGRLRSVPSVRL